MLSREENQEQFTVQGLCGGEGEAVFTSYFARGALPKGFVRVTLAPGASCGAHVHATDGEIFYVLSGELTVLEDGVETVLHAGECEYCADGHSHGAVNRSSQPASYLAIMVK